jgi:CRISPR-associated endonuclease Cas2
MQYPTLNQSAPNDPGIDLSASSIDLKISKLESWLETYKNDKTKNMLYLIAYDIEDNKIRTQIAKYLIKKGCMRIQKSMYLAKSNKTTYTDIYETLRDINVMYKNHDSIIVLPVPEEKFKNIKLIGQNIEFEVVTKEHNVLFF